MDRHKLTCTITVEEIGRETNSDIEFDGECNGSMIATMIVQLLKATDVARKQFEERGETSEDNKKW